MNNINKIQNTDEQLRRLAAQRIIYWDAKRIFVLQIILSIPVVFVFSVIVAFYQELNVYLSLYGIVLTILDLSIISPLQKSIKRNAAKVQEIFDCDVLHINWRKFKMGKKPDLETIYDASQRYLSRYKDFSKLKNWYPKNLDKLPIELARIICQRANCWWDSKLRKRYAYSMLALSLILSVLVFLIGLIGGMSMEKFILVVVTPLLPVFALSVREYLDNLECANLVDDLKNHSDNLWSSALLAKNKNGLDEESRFLQDQIFDRRSNGPLVLDWVYKLLKNPFEDKMNKAASILVKEAFKSNSKYLKS